MGSQQCQQCKQHKLQNYAYGDYELLHESTQKKVQKDSKLQAKVIKQLEERRKIKNPHIVKLHKYAIHHEDFGFKVTMFYEYVPKSLRHRIQEMQFKESPFSQREVFALIYGVENALQQLQKLQIKHCCINLDTIVCRNNFYKLTDVSSTTYITSYDLVKKGNRQQFLSQKLLQNLSHQSLDPTYELKDDYFSLGMIVLLMVSGKNNSQFYEWDQKRGTYASLNIKQIDLALKQIERNYSSKLLKKVRELIFDIENEKSQLTNLTDTLLELDQEMNRVLTKYKKHNFSSISTNPHSHSESFRQN